VGGGWYTLDRGEWPEVRETDSGLCSQSDHRGPEHQIARSPDSETESEAEDVVAKIRKLAEPTDSVAEENEAGGGKKNRQGSRIDRMDQTLRKVVRKVKRDNFEFAALNEKLDKIDNEQRRNSLIILIPRGYPELMGPTEDNTNFEQRKMVVEELFDKFIEKDAYKITAVRHLNAGRKGRQLCEVTFAEMKQAGEVRKTFVSKVKTQDNLREVVINVNQSVATRIRVEILKILANRITEEANIGTAKVIAHLAKPIILMEASNGQKRPLSYLQAIKTWRYLLQGSDMDRIYEKMKRNGFTGSPEHAFAFLEGSESEDEVKETKSKPARKKVFGKRSGPVKRPLGDSDGPTSSAKTEKMIKSMSMFLVSNLKIKLKITTEFLPLLNRSN
jgi:hypothetical protein